MGKPTICICENKDTHISFAVTAKLINAFVFATQIVQFLFFLNPKFQASSHLLWLYRPLCVRPVRKPHCWFSHEAAHIIMISNYVFFNRFLHLMVVTNFFVSFNIPYFLFIFYVFQFSSWHVQKLVLKMKLYLDFTKTA